MKNEFFPGNFLSLLKRCKRVMVSTGAGTSAESGAPTFRSGPDALWRNVDPRDLATPEAFEADPRKVWEWYDWRRQKYASLQPNAGHYALVELEAMVPEFCLFTQNIDGLHQRAGSKRVYELHGNIWHARCTREQVVRPLSQNPLPELPPRCDCGALLRPHVVWFGESLPSDVLDLAFRTAGDCDVFFMIGSSATVQPAASLAWVAKENGAIVAEINPESTDVSDIADESYRGKSGVLLPMLIEELKKHGR